jgi:hypothetical protein
MLSPTGVVVVNQEVVRLAPDLAIFRHLGDGLRGIFKIP